MITDQAKNNIVQIGGGAAKEYTIKASRKAFKILSSQLYSNKIKAFIREISSNAYDAHVEAGIPEIPFEAHLPTTLEPFFSVRDFGKGMSHEEIQTIYSTYFESTKSDSNDFIGCMGLGSKSPLSYVDNFQVISTHGGVKRSYSVFVNSDGVPSVALMGETKSDTTGVEVIIPVESDNDFYRCVSEAESVYQWFDVPPKTNMNLNFSPKDVLLSGDGWKILRKHSYDSSVAIMGNIAYPISSQQLPDDFRYINMVLEFNIGDVETTASRENLEYTRKTIDSLERVINRIKKEITQSVKSRLEKCDSMWGAACVYNEFFLDKYNLAKLVDASTILWNGQEIKKSWNVNELSNQLGIRSPILLGLKTTRGGRLIARADMRLTPSKTHLKIFENDLKSGGLAELRRYIANENSQYFGDDRRKKQYILLDPNDQAFYNEITVDKNDTIKMSSIKVARPPTTRLRQKASMTTVLYGGSDDSHEISDGGFFIPAKFGLFYSEKDQTTKKGDYNFRIIKAYEAFYGEKVERLWGVTPANIGKVVKKGPWVNIYEKCVEFANKSQDIYGEHIIKRQLVDILGFHNFDIAPMLEFSFKDDSLFLRHLFLIHWALDNTDEKFEYCSMFVDEVSESIYNVKNEARKHLSEIKERYPLYDIFERSYLGGWSRAKRTQILYDYISAMDNKENSK